MTRTLKLRRKQMRTRHQDGWVELRGRKVKRWYGHFYIYERDEHGQEKRRHRGIYLGDKAKTCKGEAQDKLRDENKRRTKGQPPCRFDVVSVYLGSGKAAIELFKDAFRMS